MQSKSLVGLIGCCVAMLLVPAFAGPDREQLLETLLGEHGPTIDAVLIGELDPAAVPDWADLTAALDAVTGQKDGWASGLLWHDDLDTALSVARARGKPVLSLRMLGRLDEDLSCANSRFFRTLLYPDPAVNTILRERFVLHWHSVRPAPRLTINYGDGRVIERTITGNSLHLVLDPTTGTVIEALPGLVDAQTFAGWLGMADRLHGHMTTDGADAAAILVGHRTWSMLRPGAVPPPADEADAGAAAMRLAVSKKIVERAAFAAVRFAPRAADGSEGAPHSDAGETPPSVEPTIHPRVGGLIRVKEGGDTDAKLTRLRDSLRRDTAINVDRLRPRIVAYLAGAETEASAESLTTWVYAEVFRSPLDDPWSGLVETDAYTALDRGGVRP
ncbi:MAG: hypothetical protein AAF333_12115 [Planctomycetota bacterium]